MNSNVEGFSYEITKSNYDVKINCGTNWLPVNTSSGFNFKNSDYTPIYMLNSSSDDITQLFNNYTNTIFNVDCSNVLYSVNNNIYSKYIYNNSTIKYNPSLLTQSSPIGSFNDCLKQLVNDTNPIIYFNYDSKDTKNTVLTVTMINKNNTNNKYVFKINLNNDGKIYLDTKLKQFLLQTHLTYTYGTGVSGFTLTGDDTKCDITVYKTSGTNDLLTNINIPNFTTLIPDLSNYIVSMYNISDGSNVSNYNLITVSNEIRYMYGKIEYGGNQDSIIVQIPNFTI